MDRTAQQLCHVAEPAWPLVLQWLIEAKAQVRLLPGTVGAGPRCLQRLQIGAGCVLGAVALHTGGLLVDHGWLRLLGGGGAGLPDLATANGIPDPLGQAEAGDPSAPVPGLPGPGEADAAYLVVGWDVLGGRFALDRAGSTGRPGELCYAEPGQRPWHRLGIGYATLLARVLAGGMGDWAQAQRWDGWQQDCVRVGPGQILHTHA